MPISRRDMLRGGIALSAANAAAKLSARGRLDAEAVEQWGIYGLALKGPVDGNPFDDVHIAASFVNAGHHVRVPGFYDGGGIYRVRFSPSEPGRWTWTTESSSAALHGRRGSFECMPASAGNHGPVRVSSDGFHFVYADGTPYRQIGTTCYSWALQSDARCAQTLATLRRSPFNKIRMCVFPNVESLATDPFTRIGSGLRDWDPRKPSPAYFRRFEDRLRRLRDIGVEADVILFHPYDEKRGYSDMRRADDERYVRYAVARFSAFRHVWWSMANEYDALKSKTVADWDHLFELLQEADPHDRLRSIHQIHTYYDVRKPWITHASIQNGSAVLDDVRAELHRDFAMKPVIFDEVRYEGNSTKRWGNLTGEELVERFWWGTVGGTYVGHSETFNPDRNPDFSWLGQGGTLVGTSPPRLAFLRGILEDGPTPGIDAIQPWWGYHLAGKAFEYYLRYFGADQPSEWPVILPGGTADPRNTYRADVIDTWNMTITPVEGVFQMAVRDDYTFYDPKRPSLALPGKPWMAVRLTKV